MISNWFNLRQNLLKFSIGFAAVCCWVYGCQSAVLESLKQPNPQREAQLLEESRIQKAFADAGLRVQTPNWKEKPPRYRCQTQYFEVSFAAADASLALELASQADAVYERLKAWFQFGLPYRVKVRIEPTGSTHSNIMQDTSGRATGRAFYLNSAAHPDRHTCAHELGHLFFFRTRQDKPVPWWLNEGIAEYVATENREDSAFVSQLLGEVGRQEELLQLGNLPASGIPLWQSYQAASSFFLFLHHRYGEEKIQAMVKSFLRALPGATVGDVVLPIYGKTLVDLEAEWRAAARPAR